MALWTLRHLCDVASHGAVSSDGVLLTNQRRRIACSVDADRFTWRCRSGNAGVDADDLSMGQIVWVREIILKLLYLKRNSPCALCWSDLRVGYTVVVKHGPRHFGTWDGTVQHLGQDSSALRSELSRQIGTGAEVS